jgi:FkbM family methyltransferase
MKPTCAQIPIAGGVTCCVPDSNSLLTPFVLREQGDWFEDEIAFVRKLVQPGEHVIDIGANYGTYTLSMAKIVGETGVVHAFEPASDPIAMLKRSLRLNKLPWVNLHEIGLSDHGGSADLTISANPELNSLTGNQADSESIVLSTLDAELADHEGSFTFIKMDAEGEEERILAGAERFFARQDPVVMFELKHGSEINEGLCEAFMRRGFLIYRLVPALSVLVPIPLGEALDGYLLNAFAIRPSAERRLIERGLLVPLKSEMPEAAGQIRVGDCISRLAVSPWITATHPNWEADVSVNGWEEQRRAVALASMATSPDLTTVGQIACLRLARKASQRALAGGATGSRLFTAVRIALDLGYRSEAIARLGKVVGVIMERQDPSTAFKEPFLLPLRQHEAVHGLPLSDLVTLAALECYAWKIAFSAYFAGEQVRPILERVRDLPRHDPRVERTLQLLDDKRQGTVNLMVG